MGEELAHEAIIPCQQGVLFVSQRYGDDVLTLGVSVTQPQDGENIPLPDVTIRLSKAEQRQLCLAIQGKTFLGASAGDWTEHHRHTSYDSECHLCREHWRFSP